MSDPNGQLTETLSLKSPSGATWLVDVARNADADELLLGSGWGDFARAHELQEDDLVVFTRGGGGGSGSGCSFDVLVLDSSGCEKAPCFFAANKVHGRFSGGGRRQAARRRVFRGPEPEGLGAQLRLAAAAASTHGASTSKQKCGETDKPSRAECKNSFLLLNLVCRTADYAHAQMQVCTLLTGEEPEPPTPSDSNCRVKQEPASDGEEEEEQGQGGDGDRLAAGSSYCCYYYSRSSGTLLTGGERDQMRSLVSVQPGNPAFVTVLMKTHVGHKNSMLVSQSVSHVSVVRVSTKGHA